MPPVCQVGHAGPALDVGPARGCKDGAHACRDQDRAGTGRPAPGCSAGASLVERKSPSAAPLRRAGAARRRGRCGCSTCRDLHLPPRQRRQAAPGCAALASLDPDLVITTGDNIAHPDAVPAVARRATTAPRPPGRLRPRVQRLLRPEAQEPAALPDRRTGRRASARPHSGPALAPSSCAVLGARAGSTSTNRRDSVDRGRPRLALRGVDDPHLGYDRLDRVAGPADTDADLALGVAHAPYQRVLDPYRRRRRRL